MSFIVKGIDLPEGETIVIHYANRYGEMETVYVDESDIIQISKGHRRLIDGDEVMKQLQADKREAFTKHDVWLMLSKYGAPTILEREEEK